uniref:Uncharacterized protein n=1 Tax=Myripristis murdjan TaxID=586833 RepID=A0A667XNK8_9TELE
MEDVQTVRWMFHRKQKKTPLCSLSVFSYIPPRRNEPKEMTYFKREARVCTYDRLFHQAEGYDNKVHRDDREHSKGRGFDIFTEVTTTPHQLFHLTPPHHKCYSLLMSSASSKVDLKADLMALKVCSFCPVLVYFTNPLIKNSRFRGMLLN